MHSALSSTLTNFFFYQKKSSFHRTAVIKLEMTARQDRYPFDLFNPWLLKPLISCTLKHFFFLHSTRTIDFTARPQREVRFCAKTKAAKRMRARAATVVQSSVGITATSAVLIFHQLTSEPDTCRPPPHAPCRENSAKSLFCFSVVPKIM